MAIKPESAYTYDSDLEDYEHECRKFRICIIGRAGVGKSTLLSRVFGISDEEAHVTHHREALERRTGGIHNIWDSITDETRNRALVIHDSRGFEASETESIETVKKFIEYRSNKGSLAEQLHCIWYCISLADVRPLQQSERAFFRFFRDKGIPLVFVLTKYDKLVRDRLDELAEDDENPTQEERQRANEEGKAFVERFRNELESAVGRHVRVQEVSKKPKDNRLVQSLVAETTAIVKPSLRNVWIRAQGVLATQKRAACIQDFPRRHFQTVLTQCSIPGNPLKALMLSGFFERIFHHCMAVWNLPGQSSLFTKDHIKASFREATQSYTTNTSIAATFDISGPITAPLYIRLAAKIACDLIMIFQQLFWATPRNAILTQRELGQQLQKYRSSRVRRTIHTLVDGSIGAVDYVTAYQPEKVVEVIAKVVDSAQLIVAQEVLSKDNLNIDEVPLPELPG